MRILFLILIFSSLNMMAQNEFKKKPLSGAGLNTPPATTSTDKKSSSLNFPLNLPQLSKPNSGFKTEPVIEIGKKESTIDLTQNTVYTNPNIEIIKQQNEKYKRIDLGSLILNGNFVIIKYRDFQSPDGDMVRIIHNNEPIAFQEILEPDYKRIRLDLKVGDNRIEFLALNEGTGSPNTAEFEILDENGKTIFANQWNLLTGETGMVLIVKEK